MRSIAYLSVLFALLATTASATDLQGIWQGHTQLGSRDARYVFQITKDAQDHWAATVVIDEDWGLPHTADSISVNGRDIEFSVTSRDSTYEGQLSEDGDSMTGVWSIGKRFFPLPMVRPTPATRWQETPHKTRLITVEKNVKVEVLDWGGTGRPIVLLPGLGLTAHVFSRFVPLLTPHYHVYGITRRGFGASSVPAIPAPHINVVGPNTYELMPLLNNPYDANRLGDDIIEVFNTLHIVRPVLVGHSIAGEELTSVVSRDPARVAGLVYLDGFFEYAFSDGQTYNALFTTQHPKRLTLSPGQYPKMDPSEAVHLGMHEYRNFPSVPTLAIFSFSQSGPVNVPGIADFVESERARVDRIASLLPTVHFVWLSNAAHQMWQSNEADVLREMKAFISKLPE
jgi:pimeloyl-ACP methyl ester carboxylesterase